LRGKAVNIINTKTQLSIATDDLTAFCYISRRKFVVAQDYATQLLDMLYIIDLSTCDIGPAINQTKPFYIDIATNSGDVMTQGALMNVN
jgi:hypothetical protein